MIEIRRKKYKNYAGPVLYGSRKMNRPDEGVTFLEKLVYVTAVVESGGCFGSVFMADGTGITGGLCQHATVLPRQMHWGDFWELMAFIDAGFPIEHYDLGGLLAEHDWVFQPDGRLRDANYDIKVSPYRFRNIVTPLDGSVPKEGPHWETSKGWCQAVHQILALPDTHRAQLLYEYRHFQRMIERTRFRGVLGGKAVNRFAFSRGVLHPKPFDDPHVELAMLVFLSFASNVPKWAYKAFELVLDAHGFQNKVPTTIGGSPIIDVRSKLFARELVKALESIGGSKWDDDKKYGRYQRTRSVLETMFDSAVVDDVIPSDIPEYDENDEKE